MRIVFLIMVLMHGLLHLLGFVKAFGLKDIKALTLTISKPIGIVWLITTVLFLLYGVLYLFHVKQSWLFGIIAVIISQVLVFYFWNDTKFATIPNIIIFCVVVVNLGSYIMYTEFTNRVTYDFSKNNTLPSDVLSETDIAHLPSIVQKYLHFTNAVGQPKVKNFKAEFVGQMRSKPNEDFMRLESVQYNFYQKPSRYFYMTASKMGLPATGLHLYQNETATFEVRLLNWFKVVDAKGDKMNQAETVTLLNDMCFIAPATLIDKRISWEVLNSTSVKANFKNGNTSISAVLYFDDQGKLINFISKDRYHTDGKTYNSYPWATPVEDYQRLNGYLLPSKAKLIYHTPDGDFTYGVLTYKNVLYNLSHIKR